MKHLILLLSLFYTTLCFSQTYQRSSGESAEAFVKRITKKSEFSHPIIETNEWDSTNKSILYFVPVTLDEVENVLGYLLLSQNLTTYRRILIDTFWQEGGDPQIESVFFANADKDKTRELVVMTSWSQNHSGAGVVGTLYGTFIYDNPNPTAKENQLTFLKDVSKKLDGGFEGEQDGKSVKSSYKNAAQIRAGLKKQGY